MVPILAPESSSAHTSVVRVIAISLLLLIVAGCGRGHKERTRSPDTHAPAKSLNLDEHGRIAKEDALRLAKRAAIRSGYLLSKYKLPSIEFDERGNYWYIHFVGKVAMPGHHFSVMVQAGTGEALISRGE